MGCVEKSPQLPDQDPIPLINMLIVGLQNSGKSTILSQMKGQPDSTSNVQLGIDSFIINNKLKIIAFEVAGRASSSWHNYYGTCQIVLFVIDVTRPQQYGRIKGVLQGMDRELQANAKIILIFNKIDKLLNSEVKSAQIEEVSRLTDFLNKNAEGLVSVEELKFGELEHQVFTCKCSGKEKMGLNSLVKKIYSLGIHIVGMKED